MTPNEMAFLRLIGFAEGTDTQPDPYRVCFGYRHTIVDLRDHPAVTGEWMGERLPDDMCRKAGIKPPCKSTAAGRYQIIRGTWMGTKRRLALPDFSADSQDQAALYLLASCGALQNVREGRVVEAIRKAAREWASLPGNIAKQPQRKRDDLVAVYRGAGGSLA
jgi:muramidase (phage lysozyme)